MNSILHEIDYMWGYLNVQTPNFMILHKTILMHGTCEFHIHTLENKKRLSLLLLEYMLYLEKKYHYSNVSKYIMSSCICKSFDSFFLTKEGQHLHTTCLTAAPPLMLLHYSILQDLILVM